MRKLTKEMLRSEIFSVLESSMLSDTDSRAASLSDDFYRPLEDAILNSNFWKLPNSENDMDMEKVEGGWHEQTPAGIALSDTLDIFFRDIGVPIKVVAVSIDLESNPGVGGPMEPGHRLYPDRPVAGGAQAISERGRFIMFLYLVPFGNKFNEKDVDPGQTAVGIANIVRHEYIHARQMEKRSKNQKVSRNIAKDSFENEGEIVSDTVKSREEYLSSNIEVDAYAHEFAELLLQKHGKDRALDILRGKNNIEDLELPDTLVDYFKGGSSSASLRKLKSKMYDHIYSLTLRNIYEVVRGSYPDETYERSTIKKLYLDRPTSHGGWPDGPSKSFTSNKPVNKQISGFLKDMGMLDESEVVEKVRNIVKSKS